MKTIKNLSKRYLTAIFDLREALDIQEQLRRNRSLLGVNGNKQPSFIGSREAVVNNDWYAHLRLRLRKSKDAMLPV